MRDLVKLSNVHFKLNKKEYLLYLISTVVLLTIMLLFLNGDLSSSHDVVVIIDIAIIGFYQFVSFPILAFLIFKDDKLHVYHHVSNKRRVTYLMNILLPFIVVALLPLPYILITYYDGDLGFYALYNNLFLLFGVCIFLVSHYFYIVLHNNIKKTVTKLVPIILFISYIIVYIILGVTFDLTFIPNTDHPDYFEHLQVFQNIANAVAGLFFLVFLYLLLDLYKKVYA